MNNTIKLCLTALVITGPIVVIMADKVQSVANKYDPVKYDFTWNVYDSPSANNYGQKETRDGDNTVGSYHVLLPDGRTQKVSYTVDSYGGYKAEVTYEGEAKLFSPTPKYKYEPRPVVYTPTTAKPKPKPKPEQPIKRVDKTKDAPKVEENKKPKPGQIYYKPIKDAPEPKVYYKSLPPKATPGPIYYKPLHP